MDSALTAAYAVSKYQPAFLHINYGQRTEKKELKAFEEIADYYNVKKRLVVNINHLYEIGGSSLTDRNLKISKANLKRKNIPKSYVPFRNANLLSIAVSWAEVLNAEKIYIGAVEDDSSGYPDCRKKFFESFNKVIKLGTKKLKKLEVITPVIGFTKKEIVLNSLKMKVPLYLTWSCYRNNDVACGECDSCALRLRGFRLAGINDPIPYKTKMKY